MAFVADRAPRAEASSPPGPRLKRPGPFPYTPPVPTFEYQALDASGSRRAGTLAGASEQAVLHELESRRLIPVTVVERAERARRGRIPTRWLATSYAQLADLLGAGVPLLRALKLLGGKSSKPRLAAAFAEIADRVAEGDELAAAMGDRPDAFPRVHVAMVRAGEKGGFLEDVLARLAAFVSGQNELRAKVVGSLIYPAVLVVFGVVILGIVFGIFVPMFKPLFERLERLPLPTTVLFTISDAIGAYAPVTLVVLALTGVAFWRAAKRDDVRRALTVARTRAPVLGPLTRALAAARFCRMLGTLLTNGVPVLASMEIARESAGNVLMEEAVEAAAEAVRAGDPLAGPLAESGLFAEDVVEMIAVAESANSLDQTLVTIADTIERRVDRLLGASVKLIEPLLLLAIASVVAFVAIGLILPMVELSGTL